MAPSADDLARLAWQFARRPRLDPGESAALFALLACNARGNRPTRAELCRWLAAAIKKTALYNAVAALLAEGTAIELPGGRLCLAALADAETAKTDETEAPHHSAEPETLSEPPEAFSAVPEIISAAPEAPRAHEEAFKSFATAKAAANAAQARARADLRRFAIEACQLPAAAADQILKATANDDGANIRAALEQFRYAYTTGHGTGKSRLDTCRNPVGQVIAWTRDPSQMDELPATALTFTRWQARAEQAERREQHNSQAQAEAAKDAERMALFLTRPRHEQLAALEALRAKAPTLAAALPAHFFDTGPGQNPLALTLPNERAPIIAALAAAEMLAENRAPSRTATSPQAA